MVYWYGNGRRAGSYGAVLQTWNVVIGSPGQWVIWVIFHVRVTRSSFWPGVRPEFFRFSKNAHNAKRTFEMPAPYINTLTYLLTLSRLEYSIRYSTEYSSSKKLDSHTPTYKSTFGVHYRTGSPLTGSTGSAGRWIPWSLGRWVTKLICYNSSYPLNFIFSKISRASRAG